MQHNQEAKSDANSKTLVLDALENGVPMSQIMLPNEWVLYLYDKSLFKKIANRPNFQASPYQEICTISTLYDFVYFMNLMEKKSSTAQSPSGIQKINLDMNDYIIMRKGIEPLWEDPRNSKGGTLTIKMPQTKGYDVWSLFVMYMLGETLTYDMQNINGITVSYISDSNNYHNNNSNTTTGNHYTYIKIWDGKPERTKEQFLNILPIDLLDKIRTESIMYTKYSQKGDFNKKNIIDKISSQPKSRRRHGGNLRY